MKKINFNFPKVALLILIILHILLLNRLRFFPYPELFIYPYLTSQGLIPYKQILDQHFPGLLFFPLNLSTLGMVTPEIARVWQFGVVSLTHLLLFLVAKRVLKSEKLALLVNLAYLIWQPFFEGYVFWIDSFLPLFLLPALLFLYEWERLKKGKLLFWSGLFLSLGLLFKQVTLPLIALVFFFVFFKERKLKQLSPFILGLGIPAIFLLLYVFWLGIWEDFVYWTVTFNLTTFSRMARKFPTSTLLLKALPVFGLATLFVFLDFVKKRRFLLISIFFLGSLAFAYARFDYIHLQPSLPFALLVIIGFFSGLKGFSTKAYLSFLIASLFILTPFIRTHSGNEVFFFGSFEKKLSAKVTKLANPGESVFALGTTPHIYQLTNTLPAGDIFAFQFPWFMVEAEDRLLSGIIDDPPKVVIRDENATTGGVRLISYMQKIDQYIMENYKVIDSVDGVEILTKE